MGEQLPDSEMIRRAENFVRALNVRQLLINICGPQYESPETREHWMALGGGYTAKYGSTHEEAPAWPSLKAYLRSRQDVISALEQAEKLGLLRAQFIESGEHSLHAFYCRFDLAKDVCERIRAKAFDDRTMFPGDPGEWQAKFDLYLKQNWIRDNETREAWRSKFPLVDWPSPPEHLWPV